MSSAAILFGALRVKLSSKSQTGNSLDLFAQNSGQPCKLPSFICFYVSAFVSGAVTIGLAFIAELFGPLILQVALSIYGMVGGPLLGLFICAMFLPMVNEWVSLINLFIFGLYDAQSQ